MENNNLEKIIRAEIVEKGGHITFARFMELALYHPELGYYRAGREHVGREHDYVTAPETSSAFGKCVTKALHGFWTKLKQPKRFDVIELGAGKGKLTYDILSHAEERFPALYQSMQYTMIEQNPYPQNSSRAEKYLANKKCRISTLEEMTKQSVVGCVLSNEFFDALPVHRIKMGKEKLQEVYVGYSPDGGYFELTDDMSEWEIKMYWEHHGYFLVDGQQAEVSLLGEQYMEKIATALKAGYVLTFDYGGGARNLYTEEHMDGTVMAYKGQEADIEYYRDIGEKDITADCNFTMLKNVGLHFGCRVVSFTAQEKFLMENGIMDYSPSGDGIEQQNERQAIRQLLGQGGGFGKEFKVMVQEKANSK